MNMSTTSDSQTTTSGRKRTELEQRLNRSRNLDEDGASSPPTTSLSPHTVSSEAMEAVKDLNIPGLSTDEAPKRRNPLVIVGALATAGVLMRGVYAMREGNSNLSARMMSWRIYGQAATVMMLGISMAGMDMSMDNIVAKIGRGVTGGGGKGSGD